MSDNQYQLQVITPERIFYEDDVTMVTFKTSEGEIGVKKNHIALTTPLVSGLMTIKYNGSEKKAALHEGFAEITPEQVTILADAAEWANEIDVERASEAKARAEALLEKDSPDIDTIRAKAALLRALTRLEVSHYQGEK